MMEKLYGILNTRRNYSYVCFFVSKRKEVLYYMYLLKKKAFLKAFAATRDYTVAVKKQEEGTADENKSEEYLLFEKICCMESSDEIDDIDFMSLLSLLERYADYSEAFQTSSEMLQLFEPAKIELGNLSTARKKRRVL